MNPVAVREADVHVRTALPDDAPRLAAWNAAMAWETERKRLDPDVLARGVAAIFAQPTRGSYFIAECVEAGGAAEPAGCLLVTREWSDWRCGDWWWIQSVYVAPEYRRRGVYRALHGHVRALAHSAPEVCGLRLYVEKTNDNAQRTYTAQGMADAGYLVFAEEFGRR